MSEAGTSRVALDRPVRLTELAAAVSGRPNGPDREFQSVSIDSRTLSAGDLFVALRGPSFDGHSFLADAAAKGAAAALVERSSVPDLPAVAVDDTRLAFGRFAAWWRDLHDIPVAGITGSNGKTTVKEMLARILSGWGEGVVTRGNLNNEVGVPLTLLRMGARHRFAVIEMGASRPGDIAYLCRLARPDAAVVNNAGPAHLAGFGDVEGVARAKGEMFATLREDGTAVVNIDDPHADLWLAMAASRRVIRFGMRSGADVTARGARPGAGLGWSFELVTPQGAAQVRLRIPGRHNVMNALAAAALAHALGALVEQIVRGLNEMPGVAGRLQPRPGIGGATIIDDTYNANPGSVAAALEVLAEAGAERHAWLVLGDMGELGDRSQPLHERIGGLARERRIERLYALGDLAGVAAAAFGSGARCFSSHEALAQAVTTDLQATDARRVVVLVKGSRSMHMERIADALACNGADGHHTVGQRRRS